ncbi:MAG: SDR family oxidoreductase [Rickettsiales bacterium]|nr:SDR family oxidoreductase [Rickettsiales bacterium]
MANYLIISGSSDIAKASIKILQNKNPSNKFFVTARKKEDLESLKQEFNCEGEILDASDFQATENVFSKAIENFGNIDGVCNFAGSVILKPAHLTSFEEYSNTINSSLTTAFSVVRSAGKYMKSGGSVVLIASAVALHGLANHEAIASAKGGVVSLAKSAAATYASQNLRFNVVAPGLTETKLTKKITSNEASLKFSTAMHGLGRIGKAEDIANAVCYFLSEEANWSTAQVLAVDGGLSSIQPKIKI